MTHRISRISLSAVWRIIRLSFATRILRSFPRGRRPILSLRFKGQFEGVDFNNLELIAAERLYFWVQNSRTYSPRHGWSAITSDSGFMRAGFSPQSELGPALMGLAPACALATHCTGHCSTCVAQGVRGPRWFDVVPTFLPVSRGSLLWQI